jgi:hypothetical protein
LGKVKPQEPGSGIFSWWKDDNADAVGVTMSESPPAAAPFRVANCLVACNDNPECAAVVFHATNTTQGWVTLPDSNPKPGCVFKKGIISVPSLDETETQKRSMIRYRTSYPSAEEPRQLPWN